MPNYLPIADKATLDAVNAKVGIMLDNLKVALPSNTIRLSKDIEQNFGPDVQGAFQLYQILVGYTGVVRLTWDACITDTTSHSRVFRLYVKGILIYETSFSNTSYQTFSVDIGVTAGDVIRLDLFHNVSKHASSVKNLRVKYDLVDSIGYGLVL